MATQLKNDLLRNPENSAIVEGLTSEDPEVYAQAMADLGHLAQNKFGLELSEINLYDAEKTDSASLADTQLSNVKGATVVDQNNEQYGNIFLDAGDGASKTDLANTLGHEVLETQDLQGKDSSLMGGLLGTNSEQTQEALNNAFGSQFANRINQAAGGDLDNTGGMDFSNNLKSSQAVAAGTTSANQVGNSTVDHRQLNRNEANLMDQARAKIIANGVLSPETKDSQLKSLNALACAAVECASGVSINDPNYKELKALQAAGKQLEAEGLNIASTMEELGVDISVTKGSGRSKRETEEFQYTGTDKLDDVIGSNEEIVSRIGQAGQVVAGGVTAAAGGALCTSGFGCVVGGGVAALGANEAYEGAQALSQDYQYENGQRVQDSFSTDTHQGNYSPTSDAVVSTMLTVGEVAAGGVALKTADKVADAVTPSVKKLDDVAATPKGYVVDKSHSGNNGSYEGEGDFDGKTAWEAEYDLAKKNNYTTESSGVWWPDNIQGYDKIPGTEGSDTYRAGDEISRMIRRSDIDKHHNGTYKLQNDMGTYVSPPGVSFEERALPGEASEYVEVILKPKADVHVETSITAPWFNKEGLGRQDRLPEPVATSGNYEVIDVKEVISNSKK